MKTMFVWIAVASTAMATAVSAKAPFKVAGMFTESCSCSAPCKCELTGDVPPSCQGVGAYSFTSGSYGGASLAGVKLAYAGKPGEWVRFYIDAPDKARRDAAEKFARAYFAPWGTVEAVRDSKVEFTNAGGNRTVMVDGGKTMSYTIAPVLGGDGKTPLTHGNTHSAISPTFMQAKATAPVVYQDGDRKIEVPAGRNGYFHDKLESSGDV